MWLVEGTCGYGHMDMGSFCIWMGFSGYTGRSFYNLHWLLLATCLSLARLEYPHFCQPSSLRLYVFLAFREKELEGASLQYILFPLFF